MIKFYKIHTALGASRSFFSHLDVASGTVVQVDAKPSEPELIRVEVHLVNVAESYKFIEMFRDLEISK